MNKKLQEIRVRDVLNYQIPPSVMNKIVFCCVLMCACLVFVTNAEGIPMMTEDNLIEYFLWLETKYFRIAYITILLLFFCVYLLCGRWFIGFCILETITFLLGTANKVVYPSRRQYISFTDLSVAGEAANVQLDYSQFLNKIQMILLVVAIIFGVLIFKIEKEVPKIRPWKSLTGAASRVVALLIIVFLFVYSYGMNPTVDVYLEINSFKKTGGIVWFCQSIFGNTPLDVTEENIEEIYAKYRAEGENENNMGMQKPNIIVVMSEAFWDMNKAQNNLQMDVNPMDTYYELAQNGISGETAVNVYGGGTNISEFEFLTGLSAMNLTGTANPYGSFFEKEQGTFVSYLRDLGYYTIAMHPYDGTFWNREGAYPNMGFCEFIDGEQFYNTSMCHGYISDDSLTKEIIERFEKQKENNREQPVFLFSVSVQNHVVDLDEKEEDQMDMDIHTTVLKETIDLQTREDIREYVNGMAQSVDALEELLAYFDNCDEDTMIVFFGDHAPSFAIELCDSSLGGDDPDFYRTPYCIWTNYENDYEAKETINLNYLSAVLVDYLDFPETDQFYANQYLCSRYPVNTKYENCGEMENYAQDVKDTTLIVHYAYERFPIQENALDYWKIKK